MDKQMIENLIDKWLAVVEKLDIRPTYKSKRNDWITFWVNWCRQENFKRMRKSDCMKEASKARKKKYEVILPEEPEQVALEMVRYTGPEERRPAPTYFSENDLLGLNDWDKVEEVKQDLLDLDNFIQSNESKLDLKEKFVVESIMDSLIKELEDSINKLEEEPAQIKRMLALPAPPPPPKTISEEIVEEIEKEILKIEEEIKENEIVNEAKLLPEFPIKEKPNNIPDWFKIHTPTFEEVEQEEKAAEIAREAENALNDLIAYLEGEPDLLFERPKFPSRRKQTRSKGRIELPFEKQEIRFRKGKPYLRKIIESKAKELQSKIGSGGESLTKEDFLSYMEQFYTRVKNLLIEKFSNLSIAPSSAPKQEMKPSGKYAKAKAEGRPFPMNKTQEKLADEYKIDFNESPTSGEDRAIRSIILTNYPPYIDPTTNTSISSYDQAKLEIEKIKKQKGIMGQLGKRGTKTKAPSFLESIRQSKKD